MKKAIKYTLSKKSIKACIEIMLFTVVLLLLGACETAKNDVSLELEPRIEKISMTKEEYDKAYSDLDTYVYRIMDFSNELSNILNSDPEILANKSVNMAQNPKVCASREALNEVYNEIRTYDCSKLSSEFVECFDELQSYAAQMVTYSDDLSVEMPLEEFYDLVINGLTSSQNEYVQNIGDLLVKAENAFSHLDTSSPMNDSDLGFTNKYGTPTTICANEGCLNYIATSGDTCYCTEHSNRCLNCNQYIDGDAMYCMSCLTSYVDKKTGRTKNNDSKTTCHYKDSGGSICGANTNKYENLCDRHFEELYDLYRELGGTKVPKS